MILLHLGLLTLEVVIYDDLLLNVVKKLVTNPISIVDALGDGRVASPEVIDHIHHLVEILVRQDCADAIRILRFLVLLKN